MWPPLTPVPGYGPNAGLLFQNHIYPPGVDSDLPFQNATYLIQIHTGLFKNIPRVGMYLPVLLLGELLRMPFTSLIESNMRDQLYSQRRMLKSYNCGGQKLERSISRVLGNDHPCITTLKVHHISVEFAKDAPFHVYTNWVNELQNGLGAPFDASLSCTALLSIHLKRFVIHRVVRPPMQAEFHLLDLHAISSTNGSHGVRVVCFDVIALARLIHRLWWHYLPDTKSNSSKNDTGLVFLEIAKTKYQQVPSDSSFAEVLNGLGSAVSLPVDLIYSTRNDEEDDATDEEDLVEDDDTNSSLFEGASSIGVRNIADTGSTITGEDELSVSHSVVADCAPLAGKNLGDALALKTNVGSKERGKHELFRTYSFSSDDSSVTFLEPIRKSKRKQVSVSTAAASTNNGATYAKVIVEALQALQYHLDDDDLVNNRSRKSLTRRVQVTRSNVLQVDTQQFFSSLKEKVEEYHKFLDSTLKKKSMTNFGGLKRSAVCLFTSMPCPAKEKIARLSQLFKLADAISFNSLPHLVRDCTLAQIHTHLIAALKSIDSLAPWKTGIDNYLEGCGDDQENGLLVYSLLQWARNHLFLLAETVAGQMQIIGKNTFPPMEIIVALGSTTPIEEAMFRPHPVLHALDLRVTIYANGSGSLVNSSTLKQLFRVFQQFAPQNTTTDEVYHKSQIAVTVPSDTSDFDESENEHGGDNRQGGPNHDFCKQSDRVKDSLPVEIFITAVSSICVPNVYGINLYNLPRGHSIPIWDLLRVHDHFPERISDSFYLEPVQLYQPVRNFDGFDSLLFETFSHQKHRKGKIIKLSVDFENDKRMEAVDKLLSTDWSKKLYSIYREHILAPCELCRLDRQKNYLKCVHCTNMAVGRCCGHVFLTTPKKLGICDLRRLRNPSEFVNDRAESLYLNDEIVNSYLDLLALKFHKNNNAGKNFFFNSFFMEKMMNLTQMGDESIESAVYNYHAVKNWVARKLLPKMRGTTRKTTSVGFTTFVGGGLFFIPINWQAHWILATVDMDNRTISIYDSFCPSTSRTFDDGGTGIFGLAIIRCLHDFYEEHKLGNFEVDDWTCKFPRCCRQDNYVDCGVFTLAYIHMLVCGFSPDTSIDGECWRKLILNCLVSGEILWPPATKQMLM